MRIKPYHCIVFRYHEICVLQCLLPHSRCTQSTNGDGTSAPTFPNSDDSGESNDFCAPGPLNLQMDQQTGLCARYGYLLTRLCTVPKDTSRFGAFLDTFRRTGDCPVRTRLLRLRCPLTVIEGGSGLGEWIGAYSSTSQEWEELGLDVRRRLRLAFDSESEFWIPLSDALRHMAGAIICRMPDTGIINLKGRTWQLNEHHGAWHGHQAGGSIRYRDTFLDNPQYTFDIINDSEEVLLALIRKYDRDPVTLVIEPNKNPAPIGMGLFQIRLTVSRGFWDNVAYRSITYLSHQLLVSVVEACFDQTGINVSLEIECWLYLLSDALFICHAYAGLVHHYPDKNWHVDPKRWSTKFEQRELTLDVPHSSGFDFFYGDCKQAVRLHIISASNLLWPDGKNPPSPYCIVNSEDNPVRTVTRTGTNNPIWDEAFLFYRRRPGRIPITIVIMDKRMIGFDVFLGRHCFKETEINQPGQQEMALFGRDTKEERFMRMKGSLLVEFHVVSSEDFMGI
ncbi:Calpain-5 [Fasciola hepatica]|uniref:Calpain-5 n=1 Tax=Fasciola hepatica TaxID=6192 RepID=A0A4E0RV30_FASHE|nr:Calpain-5 [Fasciola hepatica]